MWILAMNMEASNGCGGLQGMWGLIMGMEDDNGYGG